MRGTEWHLPFGANLVGKEQTRFRIWAPGQQELSLAVEGRGPLAMTACAGGWFEATANCGPGTRYWYLLQDGTAVPDPHRAPKTAMCTAPASSSIPPRITGATRIGAATLGSERCFTNCMPASSAGSPE